MRSLFILAAVVASSVLASDDVIVLTDANWADEIKTLEVALVKFYAPWSVIFLASLQRDNGKYISQDSANRYLLEESVNRLYSSKEDISQLGH